MCPAFGGPARRKVELEPPVEVEVPANVQPGPFVLVLTPSLAGTHSDRQSPRRPGEHAGQAALDCVPGLRSSPCWISDVRCLTRK